MCTFVQYVGIDLCTFVCMFMQIVVLGDSGVGKTLLISNLCSSKDPNRLQSTVGKCNLFMQVLAHTYIMLNYPVVFGNNGDKFS